MTCFREDFNYQKICQSLNNDPKLKEQVKYIQIVCQQEVLNKIIKNGRNDRVLWEIFSNRSTVYKIKEKDIALAGEQMNINFRY